MSKNTVLLDFTNSDFDLLQKMLKKAAIEELLSRFGKREFTYKDDGSVITDADLAMQKRLEQELKQAWPEIALLGEEMTEAEQQAVIDSGEAYWCLDPLDGSNNYAAGLPLFAVSIALIVAGQSVQGLIYDPTRDEMFTARKGEGAFLNGEKLSARNSKRYAHRILAEIDMKRLPKNLSIRLIGEPPYGSQRNSGSSAIGWCWAAAGRVDVYLHGGQKLWDYAAGQLIFSEVGGRSISLDGDPVFRGQLETRSVLASQDPTLFDGWYQWIGIPVKR